MPNRNDREQILNFYLTKCRIGHVMSKPDIKKVVNQTDGFSHADISELYKNAQRLIFQPYIDYIDERIPENKSIPPLAYKHFKKALCTMKRTVDESELRSIEKFAREKCTHGNKKSDQDRRIHGESFASKCFCLFLTLTWTAFVVVLCSALLFGITSIKVIIEKGKEMFNETYTVVALATLVAIFVLYNCIVAFSTTTKKIGSQAEILKKIV